jgi:hypothetical protein
MAERNTFGILGDPNLPMRVERRIIDVRGREARQQPLEFEDFLWIYSDRIILPEDPSIH